MRFSSPSNRSANSSWYSKLSKVLVAGSILVFPCALAAQTAHFSGVTTTLSSSFGFPVSVAVNSAGDVFVADPSNSAVYKIMAVNGVIPSNPTISSFGSNFSGTPEGVAVDSAGDVFVSDTNNNAVKEIVAVNGVVSSTSTVNIIGSGFNSPQGVAVDRAGDVFVAEYGTSRVKEIVAVGGVVSSSSTVNIVSSGFSHPFGVAVDSSGDVFVADSGHNAVKEIVAVSGVVSSSSTVNTVGSGFNSPSGVAVDSFGDVFVADTSNNAIKEIVAVSGVVSSSSTVNTISTAASLPYGLTLDGRGSLYIADSNNSRALELQLNSVYFGSLPVASTTPTIQTLTFTFDTAGTIGVPAVLTQGAAGLDFVDAGTGSCTTNGTSHSYSAGDFCTVDVTFTPSKVSQRLGATELLDSSANILATAYLSGTGTGPQVTFGAGAQTGIGSGFVTPTGIAADAGGVVYVVDGDAHTIVKESPNGGGYTQSLVDTLPGPAVDIAIDGAGNLYVLGGGNIYKETRSGATYTRSTILTGLINSQGMAMDGAGNFYIANLNNDVVQKWAPANGTYTSSVVTSSTVYPDAVGVDALGNVYVADNYNQRIVMETLSNGAYIESTIATGIGPAGFAVDLLGDVFITDPPHNRIAVLKPQNGTYSLSAFATALTNVTKVALDGSGNVYASQFFPGQMAGAALKIDRADGPTLSFGSVNVGSVSASQTVTLSNSGTAPLSFVVPTSGNNPHLSTNFSLDSTPITACPVVGSSSTVATLASNTACTLTISFAPTATGSIAGSLVTTDNALNAIGPGYATQTVTLGGTATAPGPPTVSSVSPTTGRTAGGTTVTITGTNLASATAVYFGTTAATIVSNTSTQIVVTTPFGSVGTVDVTVTTANGTSATSTSDRFTYFVGAPQVTGISPTIGSDQGGTSVTITGNSFTTTTTVQFGSAPAPSFTVNSDTSLTVVTPVCVCGTVDITVTNTAGPSSHSSADQFSFVPTPTVTGVSPASGPTAGGTSVTITGTNLVPSPSVSFGANAATIVSSAANQVVVTSPAGSAGTVDVIVTTGFGPSPTSAADHFTYALPPAVTGISPTSGTAAGGTSVTITGTALAGATGVSFGGNAATIVSNTATQIVATSPAGSPGIVDVTVTTAVGTSATGSTDQFTYVLSGTVGTASATLYATVTIETAGQPSAISVLTQGATGLDFQLASGGTCSTSIAYTVSQTCTVAYTFTPTYPGQRLGAAQLVTSGGVVIATAYVTGIGIGPMVGFLPGVQSAFPGSFLHPTRLAVDSVGNVFVSVAGTVSTGSFVQEILAAGGYVTVNSLGSGYSYPEGIAIDGSGNVFVADTYNNAVKEILAASGYTTVNTIGSGFSRPYGIALDVKGNVFVADQLNNSVKEIFAVGGYTTMQTLGSGFSAPRAVAVDASGNVFVADTGHNTVKEIMAAGGYTTVTALAPAGGFYSPTDLSLDGNGNLYVLNSQFNVVEELFVAGGYTASSFVPVSFPQSAGVAVDAKGNLFVTDNQNSQVHELDIFDPPSLQFANTVVASTSASQTVTVTNDGNSPLTFEVPTAGLNPSISPSFTYGGSSTCSQLSATSSPATLVVGASCTELVSFAPTATGLITGSLTMTDNALNATGPGYAAQTVSLSGTAVPPPPGVTGVSPTSGTTAGGTSVTITGTALTGATGVSFGGNAAAIVSNTDTQIVATSPAGSPGIVDVTVTTGQGTSATGSADQFTYVLSQTVGTASATQTGTLTIATGGTVAAISVVTQGIAGLDFQLASGGTCTTTGYDLGDTCTVNYTFTPTRPGVRYGAAVLYDSSGNPLATVYLTGTGLAPQVTFSTGTANTVNTVGGGFNSSFGVAVDAAGDVFVADYGNNAVKEIVAVNGVVSSSSTVNTVGSGFSGPYGVAVDGAGNVFVDDHGNTAVKEIVASNGAVSSSSTVNTLFSYSALGFNSVNGLAVDSFGNVFVAGKTSSSSASGLLKEIVAVNGVVSSSSTVNMIASASGNVGGVAVDGTGNVFVTDVTNSVVNEIVAVSGAVSSVSTVNVVGSGFSHPYGVAVDAAGNVFVGDSGNNAVKEIVVVGGVVSSTSTVNTLGSGFSNPFGVALDGSGNIFVGDFGNNAVKEIDVSDAPSLSFASTAVNSTSSDSPQTVTFTNNGNAPLNFEVPTSGLNPSITAGFTLGSGSTCPQLSTTSSVATLAAGASCTELISFAPTASGPITASLATTDNALNAAGPAYATQTISLSGTATVSSLSATTAVASTVLTQGHAATAFTPVTASGGTGTLTYTVAPDLPAGLVFSATGVVSGTPTVVSAATTYTVTVTDPSSATITATFSLTVNSAISATTATASTVLTVGHAATAFAPVTASGGTGTLTYTVAPDLPAGLVFSATGVVSGTPTAVSAATTYTVTVTDTNGATTTATFSLTVNSAITATTASSSTVLTQGHAATAFAPVTASGGTGTLTYTVAPDLPAGLVFSATGVVSGTPTVVSAATTYTVTVTDTNGATTTATFSLTVDSAGVTTTTSVASSSLTPVYGSTVVLTATVTPTPADNPPGTVSFYTGSTLLGTVALDPAGVATLSIALPLGPNVITAVYSGSANSMGSTSSALSVSNRASTSAVFSASPTTQLYNNPIVLTAQVSSSTAGTLGGTMSFLDGTTVVATVPLGANGQATYSVATLADGSHSLTAAYSGDGNFLPTGSTGAAVAITVGDVNLNLGGDQNQSVLPGAAVAYTFPLSPLVTPTFIYDVHLTATGLPPGATYTFSPALIPAGSASLPVTLTVQTAKGIGSLGVPAPPGQQNSLRGIAALAFALLFPLLGAKPVRKRLKAMPRLLAAAFFTALCLGAMAGMTGCGSGGFYGATSISGNYTITVTATSADLVRVSTVQLTIQ